MAIELRTGTHRPARREDYCTKSTAVAPRVMPTPLWDKFLRRVTGGEVGDLDALAASAELISYLQRVAGYCLTGLTDEHVMFFLYGTGANGKSVFLNTLVKVWGDYAVVAPMETFVESQGDRHPTELAGLRGARLVISQETEKGRHWAEAKIKSLTGGDRISARFMRQDFFEFTPQFKLIIAGNHKPSLRSVDEAIRRRIHLVPFEVTIPSAERDPELPIKLKDEWPGILQWAIDGCLEWQRIGLKPPQGVIAATDDYLNSEDSFLEWREECCERSPNHFDTAARLWRSWQVWTDRNNEGMGTRRDFAGTLKAHGHRDATRQNQRGYDGLRLKNTLLTSPR